ncbi:hypothetical protein AGDE_03352 [Angomonas deanei]|nr:hypothetical protein AGDE_03352 [Angomonas deanei]|eukprot:EPY40576.1 hypothetical protein AGDE_03352 [Angomonas deanei]
MTDRLYTQSLMQKQANLEETERQMYNTVHKADGKKITNEELESNINHLYTESLERKKANMEESRKKYHYEPAPSTKKVDNKTFVQHMYDDRIEAKKKTEQKLYEKYLAPTEPKKAKANP